MAQRRRSRQSALPAQRIEIDFVLLADYAQAVNNKLTVVGAGWNLWNSAQYPSLVPFGLGIGFLVPWSETNSRQRFTFTIGTEGRELFAGSADFEVGRQPGLPQGMVQRIVFGISGQVQVEAPGTYEILVSCAGATKRVTFEALQARQPPPAFG